MDDGKGSWWGVMESALFSATDLAQDVAAISKDLLFMTQRPFQETLLRRMRKAFRSQPSVYDVINQRVVAKQE